MRHHPRLSLPFLFPWLLSSVLLLASELFLPGAAAEDILDIAWPPSKLTEMGVVEIGGQALLKIPDGVEAQRAEEGAAAFIVARQAPRIELAFHSELGKAPAARRLWSSWGDICLASDGRVYVGIGDHHHDADGDGRCFIYRWSPRLQTLEKVVDMNQVVAPQPGQPAWTKVHAKIDEGKDGNIYFCCTLNAGNRAGDAKYQWTDRLPGAQLYQYSPATGRTQVFANLPPRRCTATSRLDRRRNIWWCNLEAGAGDALLGVDLSDRKFVYQSVDGAVGFNRNFALTADGSLLFNGAEGRLMQLAGQPRSIQPTGAALPMSPGMRASTRPTKDGRVFGVAHKSHQLFCYDGDSRSLTLLGPTWGLGQYTTVTELSADERYVYYLPGAHGQAFKYGTPVIQYEIATGIRKVLAFLAPAMESQIGYVPGGTYGIKLSKDDKTLYVNFNGHAADALRPDHMKPIGFGLCSFAAIHIPDSER